MAEIIVEAPDSLAAAQQAAAFLLDCCDCDTQIKYPPGDGWPCPNICGKPAHCGTGEVPFDWLASGYWTAISGSWSIGASKFSACADGTVVNLLPVCGDPPEPIAGGDGSGIGCTYPFSHAVAVDADNTIMDPHYADPENPMAAVGDYLDMWEGEIGCPFAQTACSCEAHVDGQEDTHIAAMAGTFTHTEIVPPDPPCFEPPYFGPGMATKQCINQVQIVLSCHHATGRPVATLYFFQQSTTNSLGGAGSGTCSCVHQYVETVCAQPGAYSCATPPVADEERTLTFSGSDWTASMTFKFVAPA